MRRDDMIKQRVKALRDANQFDDPDVIAYEPAPSWVESAVAIGWASGGVGPGGFKVWRLTEEGKQACESAPVGRPVMTLEQRESRAKQKATDSAIKALREGTALYGVQWLQHVIGSVALPGREPR